MATKKKVVKKSGLTLTKAKGLLNKFLILKREGQIDLNCVDAKNLYNETCKELNTFDTKEVTLYVTLYDVMISKDDEFDESLYEVSVKVNGKNIEHDVSVYEVNDN